LFFFGGWIEGNFIFFGYFFPILYIHKGNESTSALQLKEEVVENFEESFTILASCCNLFFLGYGDFQKQILNI
jgi:hypothetical protein